MTHCAYGERIPALWFTPTGLHIASAINGIGNNWINTKMDLNKWTKVEISQSLEGGSYIHRTLVDGKEIRSIKNTKPQDFTNVKVYAADPWFPTQEGFVKNINVEPKSCMPG